MRQAALQEADELHLGAHRGWHVQAGQRIVEIGRPIRPDHVVEQPDLAHHVALLPLVGEQMRGVHHLTQAQHQGGAARLQVGKRILDLAAQPHRLLVDDEDVGLEGLRGMADDRLAHLQRFLDVEVTLHRGIFAVAQLDHAGDLHEVDTCAVVEGAGDGRARNDQHVQAAEILDQRVGDRPAAPEMAEAERVMTVHQDPSVFEAPHHRSKTSTVRLAPGQQDTAFATDATAHRTAGMVHIALELGGSACRNARSRSQTDVMQQAP
jgi:hypothetical protein